MQRSIATVAGPAAGPALTARVALGIAYWAKWDANEAYYEARDNYRGDDQRVVVRDARRKREAAQAACAVAAAAWHQSEEAAVLREMRARDIAAGRRVC